MISSDFGDFHQTKYQSNQKNQRNQRFRSLFHSDFNMRSLKTTLSKKYQA